ncbi:MAG: bifunctional 4-hydroxy-2-oxoglutarate aldolase/2-dehydro-3-deoxy-phosphogluconate aldolase [Prosthecobacter sp.]|nr:bifunctional 4-hydroxy-2-oxoglutarate aldolase/2-dehydro-3-deoxy-phosphogluconate aldolase [Prosthecobacter sp.]
MNETLNMLFRHRIIPTVVIDDVSKAIPLTDALVAGRLPVVEVTLRTADSLAALERIIDRRDMLVGVGTVTTLAQFDAAWRLGARFVVTPGFDDNILRHGNRRDILVIPGAVTPTEIMQAQNMGVSLVKYFPSESFGGLRAIEALSGPFPKMRFFPTGGINQDNLRPYLENRSVFACGGTWMAKREWVKDGAWDKIQKACAEAVEVVRSVV